MHAEQLIIVYETRRLDLFSHCDAWFADPDIVINQIDAGQTCCNTCDIFQIDND